MAELRAEGEKRFSPARFLRRHLPFLFDYKSLFYYFLLVFFVGVAWCFYSLVTNGFTQLYNWDYTWQYVPIGYYTHDVWTEFFQTGHFNLYSQETFLGADGIGANAYYGLFDPFVVWMALFPREAVPQLFAVATFVKGACGALAMRAYLRYRGVGETYSRVGGLAFAFCGFFNFMVGFPDVVSAVVFLPLLLLGIEKVIRERKPTWLSLALFLVGLSNFFYLVVYCVFGVIYSLWRYFMTFRERKGYREQLSVIGVGVFAFAVGLLLCSFVLFPSLRNTSLSGRTDSIGQAYLKTLVDSLKSFDLGTFFSTVFSMVGENPGRELMCLISFFYPTVNYSYLPLAVPSGQGYDAWTASIFCYTPVTIFFVLGLLRALRKKRWGVLAGFGLCAVACFTTFSYYFFYLFSGDGYGRWLVVLVPLIIHLAADTMEHFRDGPDYELPLASGITLFMTVMTLVICHLSLDGKTFVSENHLTYYPSSFTNVSYSSTVYVAVYQIILLLFEVIAIFYLRSKKVLPKALMLFVIVETVVAGNLSFSFGGLWNYENWFEGGIVNHTNAQRAADEINDLDSHSFYRVYSDFYEVKNDGLTYGYGGASHFHSLFNYDLVDFARLTGITRNESLPVATYGGYTYTNKVWSANYDNKRFGFDTVTGHKYYILRNEGYEGFDTVDYPHVNVPFGSTLVSYGEAYRIYESGLRFELGHGVDTLYRMNASDSEATINHSDFYPGTGSSTLSYTGIMRNEGVFLQSAVVEDEDVARLPEGENFEILNSEAGENLPSVGDYGYKRLAPLVDVYTTVPEYGGYHPEDPGLFLRDSSTWQEDPRRMAATDSLYISAESGKVVYSPASGYFNESDGAYFAMYFTPAGRSSSASAMVYVIGDKFDSEGNLLLEDVPLAYDYYMIDNYVDNNDQGAPLFGIYAEGKVKHIVICPKGGSGAFTGPYTVSTATFYMIEKSYIDGLMEKLGGSEYALQDVYRVNNDLFTFSTSFRNPKMVVTSLGYDEGFGIKAYDENANPVDGVEIYKLDGGLVGFNAPSGNIRYELSYLTPTLYWGVPLSIIGFVLLFGFNGAAFYLGYRKKEKENGK